MGKTLLKIFDKYLSNTVLFIGIIILIIIFISPLLIVINNEYFHILLIALFYYVPIYGPLLIILWIFKKIGSIATIFVSFGIILVTLSEATDYLYGVKFVYGLLVTIQPVVSIVAIVLIGTGVFYGIFDGIRKLFIRSRQ